MYAEILVEIKSKHTDKTFTYHIPEDLEDAISIGKRVVVPFGRQTLEGYVMNILSTCDIDTKEIIEVLDEEPVLNEEMLNLGHEMSKNTLSSLSACYTAMLPKALKAKHGTQINKKIVRSTS